MDINRKKVLIITEYNVVADGDQVDFHFRKDVLDRICSLNISHVAVVLKEDEPLVRAKTIEFYIFAYCKTAVSTHKADVIDEVMRMLPHNQRKRELFVSIGEEYPGIDKLSMEDFLR